MAKAIYAGSFDPITIGHMWMISESARMFDTVTVAVSQNPDKRCLFSPGERCEIIQAAVKDVGLTSVVSVETLPNSFVVDYAAANDIDFIVRGIRDVSDFDFERRMRNINSQINGSVSTVFLMPPPHLVDISSSLVKSMIGPEGWEALIKRYVPKLAAQKLQTIMKRKK